MNDRSEALSISQVSDRTNLSVHTLRYYEREGLLASDVVRTGGGRRSYSSADVEWLRVCARFRLSGMPVAEIRRYAALVAAGPGNETERFALLQAHEKRVRAQLAELTACLDIISAKAAFYGEHLADGSASELWTGGASQCLLNTELEVPSTQEDSAAPGAAA